MFTGRREEIIIIDEGSGLMNISNGIGAGVNKVRRMIEIGLYGITK